MSGWTNLDQLCRMAAEVMSDTGPCTAVHVAIRRVETEQTDGPRWTATLGQNSSGAKRTVEEALEELAMVYRSALLCRIERAEERARKARAALPSDASGDGGRDG